MDVLFLAFGEFRTGLEELLDPGVDCGAKLTELLLWTRTEDFDEGGPAIQEFLKQL